MKSNYKLDQALNFRNNYYYKIVNKILTGIVLVLSLVLLVFISVSSKDSMRPYVFSLIPILFFISFNRKNDYLILIAQLVTVIADVFMILLKNLTVGILIYLLVQLIYATYFYFRDENKKRRLIFIIVRVTLMLITPLILLAVNKLDVKTTFAIIYFINILTNLAYAIVFKDPILIAGFAIFAISDLFIGLGSVAFIKKILEHFNAVYFFYVISQVLIVFNTHNNNYFTIKK